MPTWIRGFAMSRCNGLYTGLSREKSLRILPESWLSRGQNAHPTKKTPASTQDKTPRNKEAKLIQPVNKREL
jgi:hypothetical protein